MSSAPESPHIRVFCLMFVDGVTETFPSSSFLHVIIRRKAKARRERRTRKTTTAEMKEVNIYCVYVCVFPVTALCSLTSCFHVLLSELNVMRIHLIEVLLGCEQAKKKKSIFLHHKLDFCLIFLFIL